MSNLYPFLIYVFVTTFTPGPNNIMAMTNAVQDGYKKTIRFILGVLAGMFVILLISGILNLILSEASPFCPKMDQYNGGTLHDLSCSPHLTLKTC